MLQGLTFEKIVFFAHRKSVACEYRSGENTPLQRGGSLSGENTLLQVYSRGGSLRGENNLHQILRGSLKW